LLEKKIARVDLSRKKVIVESIPEEVLEKYIGGKGLAAYYLFNEIESKIDPLSPENKLLIFNGPFTGILPGFSRHVVASKSPLTGIFCDSYSGGWFGYELAKTGYVGLIIEGKAEKLTIIRINDEKITIENAEKFKGWYISKIDSFFKNYRVLAIGPAGEKLVKFACIINDYSKPGRTGVAGRGGLGAVMGSKNLKAIIIKGTKSPLSFFPDISKNKIKDIRNRFLDYLVNEVAEGICMGGNLPAVDLSAKIKIIPVKNFRSGTVKNYHLISGEAFKGIKVKNNTCYLCPLACGLHIKVKDGIFKGIETDRIEYETVVMNGPNCGQMDIGTITMVNNLCNDYGMDTISIGNITSFIMECSEKGILDYDIQYGDSKKQIKLVHDIGQRAGMGDIFAEGLEKASIKLGLKKYAVQVKGMEVPGYDVRAPVGMALAYATSDRGGDHLRAWTIIEELNKPFIISGKAKLVKDLQDRNAALWSLIGCDNIPANTTGDPMKFVNLSIEALNDVIWKDVFGYKMDMTNFFKIGERIYNLTRMFNVREGISRKDDNIPERLREAREDTGWKIDMNDFNKMLDEYYQLRGWNNEGIPKLSTLKELGLDNLRM